MPSLLLSPAPALAQPPGPPGLPCAPLALLCLPCPAPALKNDFERKKKAIE